MPTITRSRRRLPPWAPALCFLLGWVLLTFYPRPADLVLSVYRVFRPPINADYIAAQAHLFADLDDPVAIERRVSELFPYRYDWVAYNRPWYFPTVDEAFLVMTGDCKTHLLVLASILEYRGIPYSFSASPTHVWVEYPGKRETRGENAYVAFFSADPESGARSWKRPTTVDLRRSLDSFWTAFWHYMPPHKKQTLATGFVLSILLGITLQVLRRFRGRAAGPAAIITTVLAGRRRKRPAAIDS